MKFLAKITVLCVALFLISPNSGGAQESETEKIPEITQEEKAVFAFFKLDRTRPDFDTWIKESKLYKRAPGEKSQKKVLEEENSRLFTGFAPYDPRDDFLKIRAEVTVFMSFKKDGSANINFKFPHTRRSETPYFPFPYGEKSIAVVVEELKGFYSVPLTPQEYQHIKQYIYSTAPTKSTLDLELRPISSDATKTLLLHGVHQWLMLADIASLKFEHYDEYNLKSVDLWSYKAPWHAEKTENAAQDATEQ